MFKFIVISVLFVHIGITDGQYPCCNDPEPMYTFLRNATFNARKDFHHIMLTRRDLPRINVTMKMYEWARRHNLSAELNKYLRERFDEAQKLYSEVAIVLQQLPEFFDKLERIKENLELSEVTADQMQEELFNAVNQTVASAACCIYWHVQNLNDMNGDLEGSNYYDDNVLVDYHDIYKDGYPHHYSDSLGMHSKSNTDDYQL